LYVKSLPVMERFYCDVLGFYVTDRLGNGDQEMLFLSRSLLEHHQVVLAPGRAETSASTINQISFEIETLPKLIDAFQALTDYGVAGMQAMNHGGSWSLYVPPHATTDLDLGQSEALIREQTERLAKQTPGSQTWKEWRQDFQKRMNLEV
jgi:catechol 2,3-dioxygenase-like lactoylglutathione lyase family enzyme